MKRISTVEAKDLAPVDALKVQGKSGQEWGNSGGSSLILSVEERGTH